MSRVALILLGLMPAFLPASDGDDETYRHACVFSEREQAWLCVNRDADDDKTLYRRNDGGWLVVPSKVITIHALGA